MNYLDLFHGIGGFALGAYWAGMKFENHYCSDIEPYCQKLYAMRFPDSIQLGDITKIDTAKLPAGEWIISGGFPCQDISIAGKGAGIHGKRSGLWFEYWRIINDLRPRFAIMENVGMLIHRGLREVLGSLAEIGYNAEWQDIRASDMGAPHRRERIWIVAYPRYLRGGDKIKGVLRIMQENKSIINTIAGSNKTRKLSNARLFRSEIGEEQATGIEQLHQKFPDTECEGFIEGYLSETRQTSRCFGKQFKNWTIEPSVGRLVNGLSGRVDRLKGLGNAIVPQIAELLFRQIKPLL
jgi:DNA (cytosine-5)-methyltransferase 1